MLLVLEIQINHDLIYTYTAQPHWKKKSKDKTGCDRSSLVVHVAEKQNRAEGKRKKQISQQNRSETQNTKHGEEAAATATGRRWALLRAAVMCTRNMYLALHPTDTCLGLKSWSTFNYKPIHTGGREREGPGGRRQESL